MKLLRPALFLLILFFFSGPLVAQQATGDTQALTLASGAYAALAGPTVISDVTLSGTAERIAGSDDETGTVSLQALAAGASRMSLSLSSGPRIEVQNLAGTAPVGSWSGPDGVSHAIAQHNLMTDPSWFFPALALSRMLSTPGYMVKYVGQETWNSTSVQHISFYQQNSDALLQQLTQMDFYLDSTTLLPVAATYNIHPDNDAGLDIPVTIQFSGYAANSGVQVPLHVQKYINNNLALDLQLQAARFNTGLSASAF